MGLALGQLALAHLQLLCLGNHEVLDDMHAPLCCPRPTRSPSSRLTWHDTPPDNSTNIVCLAAFSMAMPYMRASCACTYVCNLCMRRAVSQRTKHLQHVFNCVCTSRSIPSFKQ